MVMANHTISPKLTQILCIKVMSSINVKLSKLGIYSLHTNTSLENVIFQILRVLASFTSFAILAIVYKQGNFIYKSTYFICIKRSGLPHQTCQNLQLRKYLIFFKILMKLGFV
jgi:hypothetical protein